MTSLPVISIPTVALFFTEVRGYSKLYDHVADSPLGKLKKQQKMFQILLKFLSVTWPLCFQVGPAFSWVWFHSCSLLTCASTGFTASYTISLFTRWGHLCFFVLAIYNCWIVEMSLSCVKLYWPHCSLVPNSCFTNHTTSGRSPLPLPVMLFIQWTASCKECPTTSTRSSSPSTRCSTWLFTFSLTSGPSPSTTATIVYPELWRASSTAQLTTLTTTSSSTTTTVNISLCGTAWEAPIGTRQLWWGKVPMIWSGNFKQRESWEMTKRSLTGKWMDGLRGELPVRRSNSTRVMNNFRKWSLFFCKDNLLKPSVLESNWSSCMCQISLCKNWVLVEQWVNVKWLPLVGLHTHTNHKLSTNIRRWGVVL